ncbi:MAG: hypothetical protein IRZ16_12895 [Myxococcaceae bacterium]|nr:hypothetical protein [Myxococcaceae bacterium]
MRTILIAAMTAMALVTAGCVPDDAPVIIRQVKGLTGTADNCSAGELGILRGSLDVSAPTTYLGVLDLRSETGSVIQPGAGVNTEVERTDPNDVILDTIHYDYASNADTLPTTTQFEDEPIYALVPAGSDTPIVNFPFFGSKARESLPTSGVDATGVTVNVGIQLEGRFRSGGGRVKTNRIVFPIVVFDSGFTGCDPATQVLALNGPCETPGGVNGIPVVCCPIDNPGCASSE